jgi:hypothetical protein
MAVGLGLMVMVTVWPIGLGHRLSVTEMSLKVLFTDIAVDMLLMGNSPVVGFAETAIGPDTPTSSYVKE